MQSKLYDIIILYMLITAMAWSHSDDTAICVTCIFSLMWMTSCFHIIGLR